MPVRLESANPQSRVKHSTTEPLRSLNFKWLSAGKRGYKKYLHSAGQWLNLHKNIENILIKKMTDLRYVSRIPRGLYASNCRLILRWCFFSLSYMQACIAAGKCWFAYNQRSKSLMPYKLKNNFFLTQKHTIYRIPSNKGTHSYITSPGADLESFVGSTLFSKMVYIKFWKRCTYTEEYGLQPLHFLEYQQAEQGSS